MAAKKVSAKKTPAKKTQVKKSSAPKKSGGNTRSANAAENDVLSRGKRYRDFPVMHDLITEIGERGDNAVMKASIPMYFKHKDADIGGVTDAEYRALVADVKKLEKMYNRNRARRGR